MLLFSLTLSNFSIGVSFMIVRFGKVKSCEVIRDQKTGDSLQYAFVEFEDQPACEQAFFKMDNVLIGRFILSNSFQNSYYRSAL